MCVQSAISIARGIGDNMKKFTKAFVIVCLLLALVMSLVACATTGTLGKDEQGRFKLAIPEVTIDNNTLSWKAVRYCKEYGVMIEGAEKEEIIDKTTYTLIGDKDAKVKVRAIGDNEKTVSSPYSKEFSYKAKLRLPNPQMPEIIEDGDNIVISWNSIDKAVSYTIKQTTSMDSTTKTYTTKNNSYKIAKKDISEPNVYYFQVLANGDNKDIIPSDYSEMGRYLVDKKLDLPVPKLENNDISWDSIDDATDYRVFVQKIENGEGVGEPVMVEDDITNRHYSQTKVKSAIEKYNELQKLENATGEYKLFIQAYHDGHSEIYKNSDLAEVKKVVTNEEDKDKPNLEEITFKKPALVTNIKIDKNATITNEDGSTALADMLNWEKVGDFENYKLFFYSGEKLIFDKSADGTVEYNLTSLFNKSEHIGKVFEIAVAVANDFNNGIIEGDSVYYKLNDSDEKNAKYSPIPNQLDKITDAENKYFGYYEIKTLGDLQYVMQNSTTLANEANVKFVINAPDKKLDGNGADFFAGTNNLPFLIEGNNCVILNINLIVENATEISLFNEITADGIIRNLTFYNVNIVSATSKNGIALIAQTNNGIIENININSSTFDTKSQTAGIVIQNNNEIRSCSLYSTKIITNGIQEKNDSKSAGAICNVAGIALTNAGTIFNASIYNAEITATTEFVDVRAGGVTANNTGTIKNTFVRKSKVIAKTSASDTYNVSSIAGGLIAVNSGSVSECYVQNDGNTSKAVEANTAAGTPALRVAMAGGLIGKATGGSVKSCYVAHMRITSNKTVSGMIAAKTGGDFTISDAFVFNIDLSGIERAMILSETTGVVSNKVYCVTKMMTGVVNSNNAISVERAKLIDQELAGFAKCTTNSTDFKTLVNMIYVEGNKYSVEYSTSTTERTINAYRVDADGKIIPCGEPEFACDLKKTGKKVDIYTSEIGEGVKLMLPISVNVK